MVPLPACRVLFAALCLTASLCAQPVFGGRGVPPPPKPVPTASQLGKAHDAAFAAVVEQIVAMTSNAWHAQAMLQQAAWRTEDPAVRYLLMQEGVAVAERQGAADAAIAGIGMLAYEFEIDLDEVMLALLRRMAVAPGENVRSAAAIAAWNAAYWRLGNVDAASLLRYHDVALRAAAAAGRAELHTFLNARLQWLRTWQQWQHRFGVVVQEGEPVDPRLYALAALAGGSGAVLNLPIADLAPFLKKVPAEFAQDPFRTGTVAELGHARLHALREQAADPIVAEALLRAAKAALTQGWAELDDEEKARRAALAVAWTEQLAIARGVHALRFVHEHDAQQLQMASGEWRVQDGKLVGQAVGSNNFATHRYSFRAVHSVVIRGGIASAEGLNFRCKVGDVNLLLNWEVADENHLWRHGQRDAKGPRALVAGKEHTIVLLQDQANVHVLIDGVHWWTAQATLAGTVTVYPALGSEIFVNEILIDGDLQGVVDGPSGELM